MSHQKNHQSISLMTKIVLLLGANVTLMAGSGLSVAMPAMMTAFAAVPGAEFWVSMIITLPALFVVIGGPITGFFTDRFGRKPVLVFSILLAGISGSAGYFLNNLTIILISRALVGLSIAGSSTATNALIADYFSGQQRAKFMGFQAATTGIMAAAFLLLGGFLADINWQYTFLPHVILFLLFPLAVIFIEEPEAVTSLDEIGTKSRLRLSSTVTFIFVAIFICQLTFMTVPVFIAYFMTNLLDAGSIEVGLAGAASGVFSFMAGILYERIGRRLGFREITFAGFLVFGVGFLILGLAGDWSLTIIGQLIVGFGSGLNVANLANWLANEVSLEVRGRANGYFVSLLFLGQFMTSFVFTPVANLRSYNFVYFLSAIIISLTGVFALFLKNDQNQSQTGV